MGGRLSRKRILRIITLVCVFLVLGAIVNVAVAWAAAAISVCGEQPRAMIGDSGPWGRQVPCFILARSNGFGVEQVAFTRNTFAAMPAELPPDRDVPAWARPGGLANLPISQTILTFGSGWPTRCLSAECRDSDVRWSLPKLKTLQPAQVTSLGLDTFGVQWRSAIVIRNQHVGGPFTARLLPLQPIWPGFAINTLFYAAILWALFAAPFALRRRRRIRRSLCPACAYPVGDSDVCTECGKPVSPKEVTA